MKSPAEPRAWWVAAAGLVALYGVLVVLIRIAPDNAIDSTIFDWVGAGNVQPLDDVMDWISWFTDLRPRLVLGAVGVAAIALTGRYRLAAATAVAALIITIPINTLDWLGGAATGRIRPNGAPFLAYPSGHTLGTVVQYGFGIYLVFRIGLRRGLELPLVALLALPILAVGPARVFTGLHWTTDVLGAYLLGGASVIALVLILEIGYRMLTRRERLRDSLRPMLVPAAERPRA
jgi:undecaprenyl-diphosphatase